MKKILHIAKYYYPFKGGTEQVARDCVIALKDRYDQKVICFNDGKGDLTDSVDDTEIIRMGCFVKIASQSLSHSYARKLRQVIREFDPDLIIFHYPNPFVAYFLLKYLPERCRLIVYWHLDIVKQKILRTFFISQNRRLIERADALVATSPTYIDGSEYLKTAREKCVVIPNCVNVQRLQVTPAIEAKAKQIRLANEGKVICVAVGRHTEYKGTRYLIEASRLLDDRFRFFIIGQGRLTGQLKELASGDDKIQFLGPVDDAALKSHLLSADIYCFPSVTKNEAFGISLAEGMYFGKPTVTFHIPGSGVNYVSIDGETGIEVENRNVQAYAAALERLAGDEKLRETYGNAGKRRVKNCFTHTQFEENIRTLVKKWFRSDGA